MKCPNCGREIPDASKFCPYCGTEIKERVESVPKEKEDLKTASASEPQNENVKVEVPNRTPGSTVPKGSPRPTEPIYRKWWFWVGIALISVLGAGGFIAVIVGFLTSRGSDTAGNFAFMNEPPCTVDTLILDGSLKLPYLDKINYIPDVTEYLAYSVHGPFHLDTDDTLRGFVEYSWPDVDAPANSDAFLSSEAVLMILGPRNLSKLKRGVGVKLVRYEDEVIEGGYYSITFPQVYGYKVPLTWNSQTGGSVRFSYTPEQEADYYVVVVNTPLIISNYEIETDSWGSESIRQAGYSLIGGKFSYVINAEYVRCK